MKVNLEEIFEIVAESDLQNIGRYLGSWKEFTKELNTNALFQLIRKDKSIPDEVKRKLLKNPESVKEAYKVYMATKLKEYVKDKILEDMEKEGVDSLGYGIIDNNGCYYLTHKVIGIDRYLETAEDVKSGIETFKCCDMEIPNRFVAVNKRNIDIVLHDLDFCVAILTQEPRIEIEV